MQNPTTGLTVQSLWSYLLGLPFAADEAWLKSETRGGILGWPPDMFALCASALKKSGAYIAMMDPLREPDFNTAEHAFDLQSHGEEWRRVLDGEPHDARTGPTKAVREKWEIVENILLSQKPQLELNRIVSYPILWKNLLELLAIADEACKGLGLPLGQFDRFRTKPVAHQFHVEAERLLFPKQFGSTLCKNIHPSIARVLPKMHTAQSGLTIRSLSRYLAYCESEEVRPSWLSIPASIGDTKSVLHMNLLIAPWPTKFAPKQIAEVPNPKGKIPYERFSVHVNETGGEVAECLLALAREAEKLVGKVDAVLLPELAMTEDDHRFAREALLKEGILLIAGVGSSNPPKNYLTVDFPLSEHHATYFRQRKHHRWKLEENQINQYHLGPTLDPDKHYWENIDVQARQLRFFVLRPWLVTAALICEDLARHDPIGDLIKGVGPNLLIALLMDGPQLGKRWSSRYASGYADDPGCSVLSITSLGMAALSRPRDSDVPPSRTVALWKDGFTKVQTEISVPKEAHGVVLTLSLRSRVEETADARVEKSEASYPSLTGFQAVTLPDKVPHWNQAPKPSEAISPADASTLAALAQRTAGRDYEEGRVPAGADPLSEHFMPYELRGMNGPAFRIGREIWRLKTGGDKPVDVQDPLKLRPVDWATFEEEATARKIFDWNKGNLETVIPKGRR